VRERRGRRRKQIL